MLYNYRMSKLMINDRIVTMLLCMSHLMMWKEHVELNQMLIFIIRPNTDIQLFSVGMCEYSE